jgi:hypothetical protein
MTAPRTIGEALAALLRAPAGDRSLPERLVELCLTTLDVADVAVVLGMPEGRPLLLTCAGPLAARSVEHELTTGEGPALDAASAGGPVLVSDLVERRHAVRWPAYAVAVGATSLRAQFAFPLQIGAIRLGVLSLYRDRPGRLSEEEVAAALVLADLATLLVLHLQDGADVGDLPIDVGAPFDESAELHQATGMVSVQAAVGMTEALLMLHARAYSTDRTTVAVARDVLGRRINFRRGTGKDDKSGNAEDG